MGLNRLRLRVIVIAVDGSVVHNCQQHRFFPQVCRSRLSYRTLSALGSRRAPFLLSTTMRTLYLYELSETKCISHDGYIQTGIYNHTADRHIELCDAVAARNNEEPTIHWVKTHWCPDIFKNRYKRVTFQATERANEGSPKTDNAGCEAATERPRDFPGQPESRLDRAI